MGFDYKKFLKQSVSRTVAPLNKRIMSFVVDLLLCFFIIIMPFFSYFLNMANIPETVSVDLLMENPKILLLIYVGFFTCLAIFWLYLSLSEALLGYTLGKKVFRLYVVTTDLKPISVYQALLRNLAKSLFIADFLFFDVFLMFFDKKRRRISDYLLKTLVVEQVKEINPYELSIIS